MGLGLCPSQELTQVTPRKARAQLEEGTASRKLGAPLPSLESAQAHAHTHAHAHAHTKAALLPKLPELETKTREFCHSVNAQS